MRNRLAASGVLLEIAFRNLFASRVKTLIVGGIILFGALLVVVGSSILDSVDAGMRRSIQGSLGGHVQIFDKRSREDLAIFGGMLGDSDLTPMESFAPVKKAVLAVPNVKAVVPMGIHDALVGAAGPLDNALEDLRAVVRKVVDGDRSPATLETLKAEKDHVRRILALQKDDLERASELVQDRALDRAAAADRARAASDEFWRHFDADPLDALEFLDNRIAPQALEAAMIYIRYAGTDLDAYRQAFDRVKVVEGEWVPSGRRGILLARYYAEEQLKMKIARRLDKMKEALAVGRRIKKDEELQRWVKDNLSQKQDILMQLDSIKEREAVRRLQKALGSMSTSLSELLDLLLQTDDANFEQHYRTFYDDLAPLLRLYVVNVGDTLTLKAFTQAGYMKAVNVKVWGTVEFAGLERSAFAGFTCLMDIMSFRDLYGYLTHEKAAEIATMKKEAGARDIKREDAEDALFGGGGGLVAETRAQVVDESRLLVKTDRSQQQELEARVYGQDAIDDGVALNAAVILDDPGRMAATMRDIEAATDKAGLHVKAITWQQASGMIGQFVSFSRFVLYVAVLIIFAVALVIINNAMVMATLQRVREIGTIRAIGAQRRFVLSMLLIETTAVGLAFGAAGAVLGAGVVWLIRMTGGIPAGSDQLYFFFSGPALLPSIDATSFIVSLVIVLVVSILSGLYPALIATRITPLMAMQSED